MSNRAHPEAAAMRARADAGIVAIAPVSEIVPAFLARTRMVADLIGRHPGGRRHDVGQLVKGRRLIDVERMELSSLVQGGEAGAGLDSQLIERKVLGPERQRLGQHRRPVVFIVARHTINKIEAHPPEILLCSIKRRKALAYRVSAAEEAEDRVVETLQPERYAIDASFREIGETR